MALYALVRWHTGGHVRWAGLAALGVSLTIRRVGELSDFHHLFVHLLKTDFSHQVDGLDGPVKYGYSLVVPWELGHAYEEKRGIMLSPNTPPGTCAVIVGL